VSPTEQTRLYSLSSLPQDRLSRLYRLYRLSRHVLDRPIHSALFCSCYALYKHTNTIDIDVQCICCCREQVSGCNVETGWCMKSVQNCPDNVEFKVCTAWFQLKLLNNFICCWWFNESLLRTLTLAEDGCCCSSYAYMLCKLASFPGTACCAVRVRKGWQVSCSVTTCTE